MIKTQFFVEFWWLRVPRARQKRKKKDGEEPLGENDGTMDM